MTASDQGLSTADLTGETAEEEVRDEQHDGEETTPLLPAEEGDAFQGRWRDIQVRFVDEPQGAVQEADGLVAELMQRLAAGFANERQRLEGEWERGEEVSTEDLRQALQHYRSVFKRLLSA